MIVPLPEKRGIVPMKKLLSWLLSAAVAVSLTVPFVSASYTDVPEKGALSGEVRKAVDYGLMKGYTDTTFGYGDTMTRAQFVTVLSRMLWPGDTPDTSRIPAAMELPDTLSATYRNALALAVAHGAVDSGRPFRPDAAITRGEMAELLVRGLGLKGAAELATAALPFTDVSGENAGYIAVAYAIGMTKGTSETTFSPDATATRGQAAAMLVRIYEKLQQELGWVHGFYAISSYSQLDFAQEMDAVSAGWSRMTWDGKSAVLLTSAADGNEFAIPNSYQDVTGYMEKHQLPFHLNVFMDPAGGLTNLLASPDGRTQAVEQICQELTASYKTIGTNPYDGVTIDFEGLRAGQKSAFTLFLTELSQRLRQMEKSLYVCVAPMLTAGSYYDGYDYEAISQLADRVIVMTYDYDANDLTEFVGTEYYKTAAQAPIDQVFLSMMEAVRSVSDPEKLVLGYSCKNVAWQIDANGKLLSGKPVYPSNETVHRRLGQSSTVRGWSETYQMPYATYTTEDGSRYFLWYDDSRSTQAKLDAAKLLGVRNVSLWRLGSLPMYSDWNWLGLLHS